MPARVIFFFCTDATNTDDQTTIGAICKDLGYSFEAKDFTFVNDQTQWFDEKGQRKFDIFILPGGNAHDWFETSSNRGINENGARNIKEFLNNAGSVITICHSGAGTLCGTAIWIGSSEEDIKSKAGSSWSPITHKSPGELVKRFGGIPIFRGTVSGPQDSNLPWPRARFLAIRLNDESSVVKKANLPNTAYLCVWGGGSLIPNAGQSMEVIGWFPNGTIAIGVVKYGKGNIYLVAPHPNLTLDKAVTTAKALVSSTLAKSLGISRNQMIESLATLEKEGDPDGSTPDRTVMLGILQDAAARASDPIR